MTPPCSTFDCLQTPPFRGTTGTGRYGTKCLTKENLESVKSETACSSFAARCAQRASELSVPWLVGLPAERPGKSHMLLLDEWSLPMSASVKRIYFDQCQFGSADKKPTLLFGTFPVALKASPSILNTGESNVRDGTESRCSEGYPAELCKQLAHKIWLAAVSRRTDVLRSACTTTVARTSRPGKAHLPCERVSSDNPCKALFTPRASEAQNLACLGGLRSCRRVRYRMPASCTRGALIQRALETVLSKIPGLESRCLRALGSDTDDAGPTAQNLAAARTSLTTLLPDAGPTPTWNDRFPTPVDHVLLAALRSWISDPDDQPEKWLQSGAPAGLVTMPLARHVFPVMDHFPANDPSDLGSVHKLRWR